MFRGWVCGGYSLTCFYFLTCITATRIYLFCDKKSSRSEGVAVGIFWPIVLFFYLVYLIAKGIWWLFVAGVDNKDRSPDFVGDRGIYEE